MALLLMKMDKPLAKPHPLGRASLSGSRPGFRARTSPNDSIRVGLLNHFDNFSA
jgi:hypothetical protein